MASSAQGGRRFTIADGMVMIGATAAGLAWSSQAWRDFQGDTPGMPTSWTGVRDLVLLILAMLLPSLLSWTFALAFLRTRRPRPRWRRASRQPGMTASLAAALSISLALPIVIWLVARQLSQAAMSPDLWRELSAGLLEGLMMLSPFMGLSVIFAWSMLVIQRQWRCERSWIDRAGRALGLVWIVSGAFLGAAVFTQVL